MLLQDHDEARQLGQMSAAVSAVQAIVKSHGLVVDRSEVRSLVANVDLNRLNDEQLAKLCRFRPRPVRDCRMRAALLRELPARAAVGTMGGGPTYVERATEGTECLPAKLERAIDCMRLIAGRTARPSLGISVICERCLHRWLLSCSVATLWWGAEAIGLAAALR